MAGGQPLPGDAEQRFLSFRLAAAELYDDSAWRELAALWVARARDQGALAATVIGLGFQASSQLAEGRFAAAEAAITEARTLAEAMGNRAYVAGLAEAELEVLAWRGDQAGTRLLASRLLPVKADQSGQRGKHRVHRAMAALELGLGNYQEALRHALATAADQPILSYPSSPDVLIEAAVRCGDRAAAAAALDAVAPWWQACGTPWSLGLLARCQALLADDEQAEDGYRLSVEHLRQCQVTPELGRTHLLYGEWLRRRRRRRGARDQLRAACELFATLGMEAFAARAKVELRAVGEHAALPRSGTRDTLTPQEGRSPGWPPTAPPIRRSPPSSSSVPARSTITCARSSGSSASAGGRSFPTRSARWTGAYRRVIGRAYGTTVTVAFVSEGRLSDRAGEARQLAAWPTMERTLAMRTTNDVRAAVEDELIFDPLVDPTDIQVRNIAGDVALNGTVPSYPQHQQAAAATRRVAGVISVHNHLEVVLPPGDERSDPALTTAANNALDLNITVPDSVQATAHNGVITVTGTVQYGYQRTAAETSVASLTGVRRVRDDTEIAWDADPVDVTIAVQDALDRNALVPDNSDVAVDTNANLVTLTGHVRTWAEHDAVVDAAWMTPAVYDVDDRLVVTG